MTCWFLHLNSSWRSCTETVILPFDFAQGRLVQDGQGNAAHAMTDEAVNV